MRIVIGEKEVRSSREIFDALIKLLQEAGMDCNVELLDSGKKLVQLVEYS